MKNITVGELRKALEGVPDELEVRLDSDSGIDQRLGTVIIESAERISYSNSFGDVDYFRIYANDVEEDDER